FNSRVDGMLISVSRQTTNYEHLENIFAKGVPMVFFDRSADSIDTSKVIVDDFGGAKEAVIHLIEQGCKRIAHLMSAKTLSIGMQRMQGYKEALKENGLHIDDSMIIECPEGTKEQGMNAMAQLLNLKNRPDAVFTSSDMLALGAMIAIKEAGLKIPEDVAVVGFSNWQFSEFVEPGLSTVDQPGFAMGQEAAKLLIRQIEADEDDVNTETKVLKTQLIIRGSSLRKKTK
ncbi:MAG TPA: substrate-binding domain-containing protein, partial [Cyclobacteriaceae bacterium]|nr:substrate-binding domain-containing protein [Cyclobacteriaceae bacterium]